MYPSSLIPRISVTPRTDAAQVVLNKYSAMTFNSVPELAALLLGLAALIGFIAWLGKSFLPALWEARAYCKQVQVCGHLPPPPEASGIRRMRRLSGFFTWLLAGKVEVIGRENLDKLPGKAYIVTPNHPSMTDVAVIPHVLGEHNARYMAARGVLQCFGGLGGLLFAPMGVFACDLDRGKGGPAREAAVKILVSGQSLVMWPEGWTYLDGVTGPFKKGAVRIAREAARQLGQETYIVPVNLRYGRYPGAWIKKLNIKVQYALLFVGFLWFRRGVRVSIGEPIPISSLPTDASATEILRDKVIALG